MRIIDRPLLEKLSSQAKESARLRMNYNFHQLLEDKCHRMLNAIEPNSVVPIHRHQKSSETILCIRGKLVVEFYDELERMCTESVVLAPNSAAVAVNIPIGRGIQFMPKKWEPSLWKLKMASMNQQDRKILWNYK